MGERGGGHSSHQHGRPRKDGLPVRRQLLPNEVDILASLREHIATHTQMINELDPEANSARIAELQGFKSFWKLQLRLAQKRFGQPQDPE